MSVYKPKGQKVYVFDFSIRGVRFSRSTGQTEKAKAEKVEETARKKATADLERKAAGDAAPMTISRATARYMDEVGDYHAAAETTLRNMKRLVDHFGPNKRLDEITDSDVAELVAKRRRDTVKGRRGKTAKTISPTTVNRSVTEPLQRVMNRARDAWGVHIRKMPAWKKHLLDEPGEREREVFSHEEGLLDAIRADYRPLIDFARASGLRMKECLMRKSNVNLADGKVSVVGKGRKMISQSITTEMREILEAEMKLNSTEYVFTYQAVRAKAGKDGWARGDRRPITTSGLKTLWRRAKAPLKSGPVKKHARTPKDGPRLPPDLRFHDLRHDFGTKLLRETHDLKLVQKAMHHSRIETTSRYAHVLDEEVTAGMEAAAARRKAAKAAAVARRTSKD